MASHVFHFIASSAWAPFFIFLLVAGIAAIARVDRVVLPLVPLAGAVTLFLVLTAFAYLFAPILFEDAETDIACVSALAMRGFPIYPAVDAASRYILLYGPVTYLAHIPFYLIFGASLFSFKLLGVVSFVATIVGLYGICRLYASSRVAVVGVGCASAVFFRYIGVEFWGRIDPLIIALTVVSIWATLRSPGWAAVLTNSVALSVIPNLKLSGVAYAVPLFGLLILLRGWRIALFVSLIAALLFPLPFLMPNVSWTNYLFVLRTAAVHGLVPEFLLRNVQYSILLLVPVLAALWASRKSSCLSGAQLAYFVLICGSLGVTSILGAKSGAGSYHLLPYVAPVLHLYFWLRSDPRSNADAAFARFAPAWVVTTLLLSSTHLQTVIHEFRASDLGQRSIAEINAAGRAPGSYQLGVGAEFVDPRTRYAYIPTFAGQPYIISGAAIRDLQYGGVNIPDATIRYLDSCGTEAWLIPRGDEPFSASNTYFDTPHPAFDAKFRQSFLTHYHRVSSGDLYDTWACKH